jgi:hypothetical protein
MAIPASRPSEPGIIHLALVTQRDACVATTMAG